MRILLVLTEINQRFGSLEPPTIDVHFRLSKTNGYTDIYFVTIPTKIIGKVAGRSANDPTPTGGYLYYRPPIQFIRKMVQNVSNPDVLLFWGPHPTIFPQCWNRLPLECHLPRGGEYPLLDLARALEQKAM